MGMDTFAPFSSNPLCFIVQNITCGREAKTIRIFQAPINAGGSRDLLRLEGVAESDIRASLLKGELRNRIINKEITVLCSDIDLLQFNDVNLAFLTAAGIINGTTANGSGGITAQEHETLRQFVHLADAGGPGDGFAPGAVRITTPNGSPFPTEICWFLDATLTTKLIDKVIVYNANKTPSTINWNLYAPDGITIVHTIIDSIQYTNNVFESKRTRTII